MSAIAGIYPLESRPVDAADLTRLAEALAYRGPDGTAIWHEGRAGLVHSLLRTTPSSLHERQPWTDAGGRLTISADTRLDNRDDLLSQLRLEDDPDALLPDCALIVAAYARWGEGCVDHLLGDFAFAIWDAADDKLFCARDHFGLKPLYYTSAAGQFIFATEMSALLALPQLPRRPNEEKIAQFLANDYEDKANTFFEGIFRLPPGHVLTVSGGSGPNLRRYWRLDPEIEVRRGSDEAYVEEFRALFIQAVRARMRSAYPVGSMLSGGLDSSSVTCVARDVYRERGEGPLDTFSAVMPSQPGTDESDYINAVLAGGGLRPNFMAADEVGPLYDRERMLDHLTEPIYAANTFLEWGLRGQAQARGVRMLMNGLDGDNIVSHGYAYWTELALAQRWQDLSDELHAYVSRSDGAYSRNGLLRRWGYPALEHRARQRDFVGLARDLRQIHSHFQRPYRPLVREFVLRPLTPPFLLRALGKSTGASANGFALPDLVNPALARRVRLDEHLSSDDHRFLRHKEAHYHVLTWGIAPWFFELEDLTSAPFQVESSSPFFDRRFVEFSYGIPPQQKLAGGWPRLILRRALDGILPEAVQWRFAKSNYGSPFIQSLLAHERDLLAGVRDRLDDLAPYVDVPVARGLLAALETPARAGEMEALALWKLVLLSQWLEQRVIDRSR